MLAAKTGFAKERLLGPGRASLVAEFPFDSGIKRMSMVVAGVGGGGRPGPTGNGGGSGPTGSGGDGNGAPPPLRLLTKGAFESLLALCTHVRTPTGEDALLDDAGDADAVALLRAQVEVLAQQGLRVLALAARPLTEAEAAAVVAAGPAGAAELREGLEQGLIFLGLAGLMDPPRPEVCGWGEKLGCWAAGLLGGCLSVRSPPRAHALSGGDAYTNVCSHPHPHTPHTTRYNPPPQKKKQNNNNKTNNNRRSPPCAGAARRASRCAWSRATT